MVSGSFMVESVLMSHFIALLDASCTASSLVRTTGLNTAPGSTCAVISSTSRMMSSMLAPSLGMILMRPSSPRPPIDREVGAEEPLGERHRHRYDVGNHLQYLVGKLREPAGVQVTVLDQPEDHRLEIGVAAHVSGLPPGILAG